uniref:Lipocalin-like domain-containing protein n=1 Tax=Strongyloides venezuelensis TaxID=75913 RepID=A0A0K0F4L8_STRVS
MYQSKGRLYTIIFLVTLFRNSYECSGSYGGTQNYQNPTVNMKFFTPTAWTYPPSDATTMLSYLLGQASTQTQAQNNAVTDLTSAMTSALTENELNAGLYKITATYTAPLVYDCAKSSTGTSTLLDWYEVEGDVVTKHVTGATQALTGANCISKTVQGTLTKTDFILDARISIEGLTVNTIQMTQILNAFMAQLSFGKGVKFTENPTIN